MLSRLVLISLFGQGSKVKFQVLAPTYNSNQSFAPLVRSYEKYIYPRFSEPSAFEPTFLPLVFELFSATLGTRF